MPAYFRCALRELSSKRPNEILGQLTARYREDGFATLISEAIESWEAQIPTLQTALVDYARTRSHLETWELLIEYPIPRIGKRIDAVLLCANIILLLEFKLSLYAPSSATKQVIGYAEDLRDFHASSRGHRIYPVILTTHQKPMTTPDIHASGDIAPVRIVGPNQLHDLLDEISNRAEPSHPIDPFTWDQCLYSPTPSLVQAAQSLYEKHSVSEILQASEGTEAIEGAAETIRGLVHRARDSKKKLVCFLTGVPGSGKTLVGLRVANLQGELDARFMSGNNPLIHVLREALARNLKEQGTSKGAANRLMTDRIQNIHRFSKEHYKDEQRRPPEDSHIVVYDEAQRAWDARKNAKENKGLCVSEPHMILNVLGRHDWCLLVAVIGGGQEINTGEAGIEGWRDALLEHIDWELHIPPTDETSRAFCSIDSSRITAHTTLHLSRTMRSYAAQQLTKWISALLEGRSQDAKRFAPDVLTRYPIVLTRSLDRAKAWLRQQRSYSLEHDINSRCRIGLVASSSEKRLRAWGIEVSIQLDEAPWFLNDATDIRSSSFLEIPATEYAIQGLELDYVGVCWGADLRIVGNKWDYFTLSGTHWHHVSEENALSRKFMLNTYRVLLSRARQGMIIWVPRGDAIDSTRLPVFYDLTAAYLLECGLQLIED